MPSTKEREADIRPLLGKEYKVAVGIALVRENPVRWERTLSETQEGKAVLDGEPMIYWSSISEFGRGPREEWQILPDLYLSEGQVDSLLAGAVVQVTVTARTLPIGALVSKPAITLQLV